MSRRPREEGTEQFVEWQGCNTYVGPDREPRVSFAPDGSPVLCQVTLVLPGTRNAETDSGAGLSGPVVSATRAPSLNSADSREEEHGHLL